MDRATATRTAKKIRAPPEAIKLKLPNPARRSSGIKSISLFSTPAPSPKPTSKMSGTHSKTTASLALAHSGGPFLEEFQSHLKSHAGGYRSSSTATQLARDVGKYLYFLDQSEVNEALLLDTHPVEGYLQSLSASGMGPSGILHRLLSEGSNPFHETHCKLPKSPQFRARARANTHDCSPPQMEDDAQIRKCMQHLSAIYKSQQSEGQEGALHDPSKDPGGCLWPLSTGSVKTGEHSEPTLPPSSGATFQGAGTPPASVFLPPD